MLAVGANDPFVRLYDRRMIKLATDKVIIIFFSSRSLTILIQKGYCQNFVVILSTEELRVLLKMTYFLWCRTQYSVKHSHWALRMMY